jgi:hypothetical protein
MFLFTFFRAVHLNVFNFYSLFLPFQGTSGLAALPIVGGGVGRPRPDRQPGRRQAVSSGLSRSGKQVQVGSKLSALHGVRLF